MTNVWRATVRGCVGQLDVGVNMGRYAQARIGYVYDDPGSQRGHRHGVDARRLAGGRRCVGVSRVRQPRYGVQPDARICAGARVHAAATTIWAPIAIGSAPSSASAWRCRFAATCCGSRSPAARLWAAICRPIARSRSAAPRSFPGFELGELRVDDYWTVGTSYLWKVKDVHADPQSRALRRRPARRPARPTIASTRDDDGDIYGGSVFLTGRTLVGPLTVGLGTTSTDSWSLWLSVGRPVGHGTILEKGIFR